MLLRFHAVEIYPWLRQEIIQKCIDSCPGEDFDDLEIMRKVFSVEINKFNKGIGNVQGQTPDI